jgi:hypothetical protein
VLWAYIGPCVAYSVFYILPIYLFIQARFDTSQRSHNMEPPKIYLIFVEYSDTMQSVSRISEKCFVSPFDAGVAEAAL